MYGVQSEFVLNACMDVWEWDWIFTDTISSINHNLQGINLYLNNVFKKSLEQTVCKVTQQNCQDYLTLTHSIQEAQQKSNHFSSPRQPSS